MKPRTLTVVTTQERIERYRAASAVYEALERAESEGHAAYEARVHTAMLALVQAARPLADAVDSADEMEREERLKKAGLPRAAIDQSRMLARILEREAANDAVKEGA